MVSDLHHLFPTHENVNSTRSNYPFAEIPDNITTKWMYLATTQTSIPTSNINLYSEFANNTFEPREDDKGNVARAIFYFYTMYPTQAGAMSLVGDINTFYQWHLSDPVDAKEIERNGQIETYQGDRNPYIDYPDIVARAWGLTPVNTAPNTPTLAATSTTNSINLTWNNVENETGYKIYKSTTGTSFTLLTTLAANIVSYSDAAVVSGQNYYYYITAYNTYGTSAASNTIIKQTETSGGTGIISDLIFSEYIEGSSNNKGLEIANFTGASVNLSNYVIRKQVNGAGSWSTQLALSGTLANGDVYVIVNTSASATMKAVADLITGVDALTFNGNDPVGLFKNGTLIDIIGVFNSTTVFAADVTLLRKPTVYAPSATYSATQWTSYPIDTYTYLGTHTVTGGTADTQAPTAPASLTAGSITQTTFTLSWTASTDNVGVTGYEIYQNGTLKGTSTTTSYNVTGLTAATTYSFTVKAKDAAGNVSAASAAKSVTTLSASDTQAPTAPTSLTATSISQTTFTLGWTASTDNVGVTGYEIYQNGTLKGTSTSTSYSVTGLTAATTYSFTVKAKDAAGNVSTASTAKSVTTLATSISYCASKGSNVAYEWIDYVAYGGMTNTTAANAGYGNFTATKIATVTRGTSTTINVSAGFKSSAYTEYWRVWVDWNQNGTFETTEQMVAGSSSSSATLSYTFTVPSTALLGSTRMRVTMKYNAAPTACETFSYGEVEDYTVNVTGTTLKNSTDETPIAETLGNEENTQLNLWPNPAIDYINVGISNGVRYGKATIYNISGALVKSVDFEGSDIEISISNLPAGSYFISVDDEKEKLIKQFIKK
jgi:chitodextrinase